MCVEWVIDLSHTPWSLGIPLQPQLPRALTRCPHPLFLDQASTEIRYLFVWASFEWGRRHFFRLIGAYNTVLYLAFLFPSHRLGRDMDCQPFRGIYHLAEAGELLRHITCVSQIDAHKYYW